MIKNYKLQFIPKTDMLMIGDASGNNNNYSDADIRTAEKAHIKYLDVNDFQQAAFFD